MKPLILASGSPRRAKILRDLGVDFEIVKTEAAEVAIPHDPVRTVTENACAKLRAAPDAMDLVADRFGTEVPVRPRKDGGAEVSVTVRKSAQFFGWVAGMNGAITIAGPKSLAEEYRSWLQDLAAQA